MFSLKYYSYSSASLFAISLSRYCRSRWEVSKIIFAIYNWFEFINRLNLYTQITPIDSLALLFSDRWLKRRKHFPGLLHHAEHVQLSAKSEWSVGYRNELMTFRISQIERAIEIIRRNPRILLWVTPTPRYIINWKSRVTSFCSRLFTLKLNYVNNNDIWIRDSQHEPNSANINKIVWQHRNLYNVPPFNACHPYILFPRFYTTAWYHQNMLHPQIYLYPLPRFNKNFVLDRGKDVSVIA